jgi:hypothetical protein
MKNAPIGAEDPTFKISLKILQLKQTGTVMPNSSAEVSPFKPRLSNLIKEKADKDTPI